MKFRLVEEILNYDVGETSRNFGTSFDYELSDEQESEVLDAIYSEYTPSQIREFIRTVDPQVDEVADEDLRDEYAFELVKMFAEDYAYLFANDAAETYADWNHPDEASYRY